MAALPTSLPKGDYRLAERSDGATPKRPAFAWAIGGYRFQRYKKPATATGAPGLAGGRRPRGRRARWSRALTLARDLINTPADDMGPAELADAAKAVAQGAQGASVNVIVGDDLLKKNYPAIHAVGPRRRAAAAPDRSQLGQQRTRA